MAILASMMLVSCAHRFVRVDMNSTNFKGATATISEQLKGLPKHIVVGAIRDMRDEQEILGKFQYVTIYGDGFSQWIVSRFNELQALSGKKRSGSGSVYITASVSKAYIRLLPSTLGSSVVMDVSYSCKPNISKRHFYRGDSTTMNWAFSQSEVMGLLNDTATSIIVDLVRDIRAECSSA